MPYIGKSPQNGVRNRFVYNATTSSQTAFTGSDLNGNTLSISDNLYTDVYLNGILLQPSEDYSVTSTTVTLVTGASINDVLEIIVFDIFSVADTVSASSGGTFSGAVTLSGGVSSSLTVANGLTLTDGDLTIASGHGIDFSATSDGTTSTSEILDDYEEGNWNATLTPQTSGSVGISNDGCQYVIIGQIVHVSGIVQVNSVSSPTGVMRMGGFPFACANLDDLSGGVLATINIQACAIPPYRYGMWMQEGDSTTDIFNFVTSSDQPQGSASQNFGGNESIYFSLTYRTT